jgi:hypothetical protein
MSVTRRLARACGFKRQIMLFLISSSEQLDPRAIGTGETPVSQVGRLDITS